MHIGNEATSASTVWLPSGATETTRPAPQSDNHSRPLRQRGDSPNTMPSVNTFMPGKTGRGAETHRKAVCVLEDGTAASALNGVAAFVVPAPPTGTRWLANWGLSVPGAQAPVLAAVPASRAVYAVRR